VREYPSIEAARDAFDEYARMEPGLTALWYVCRRAAPAPHANKVIGDDFDVDPFEVDVIAGDKAGDGWCAEDFFFEHVKSRLLLLVGMYRVEPDELQSSNAYDAIYSLLFDWALWRRCVCCAEDNDDLCEPCNRDDDDSRLTGRAAMSDDDNPVTGWPP
jgi:hypothetical protein